ncbi:hypothetical protein GCM10027447_17970 [Glycomyces halotolerans]
MIESPLDEQVALREFTHRHDGDEVTIALTGKDVFLSIPVEGFRLLEWLRDGATVAEASERFEREFGEAPEIGGFLDALRAEGFIADPGTEPQAAESEPATDGRGHLQWLTPRTARLFVNPVVGAVSALIVLAGIAAAISRPQVVPLADGLQFESHFALMTWLTFAIALSGVMVHEFAHVIAARAAGARARIELSNRMYVVVVQTDMTGVWMAPARQRMIAFLAGPIVDAVCVAAIMIALWGHETGRIELAPIPLMLLEGVGFTYIARIIWQCLMFWRTDFYYAVATLLKCKNLMIDTENLLRNLWRRLRRRTDLIDQSAVPPNERRAIGVYAFIWTGGRAVALWAFAAFTVPLLIYYTTECVTYLAGANPGFGWVDFATALVLGIGTNVLGIVLWARRGVLAWRRSRGSGAAA